MKVERETLLNELQMITPGLSKTETTEQSDCFVFRDGKAITFNDEIACSVNSCLQIKGAVRAGAFLTLLQKMTETALDITADKRELKVRGTHGRKAGIILEKKIELPIDSVKMPKTWQDLPSDFTEGVRLIQGFAGTDTNNNFAMTCIHICPDHIEASDNYNGGRYQIKIGVKRDVLVRQVSLKYILESGVTQFGETKNWIHFRNKEGLTMSCRRFATEFPDMDPILELEGKKVHLPKGLEEAVDRANIFASENSENDKILVRLRRDGKLLVKGSGSSGWYTEPKKLSYKGPDIPFRARVEALRYIFKEHQDCIIGTNRLKATSGKLQYIAFLWKAKISKKNEKKRKGKK